MDWTTATGSFRLNMEGREDGGLRIWSDDIAGLDISNPTPSDAWRDLGPEIERILENNERDIFPHMHKSE